MYWLARLLIIYVGLLQGGFLCGKTVKETHMNTQTRLITPARSAARAPNNFSLSQKLLRFGGQKSYLTLGGACENILMVGGMGSAKTTSSFFTSGKSLFEAGCGGLGLGVKYNARNETFQMAREAGRGHDVIMFYPGSGQRFNWIDYESKVHGPGNEIIDNLMDVFVSSTEVISRKIGQGQSEPFWEYSWRQMLKQFLFLDIHANGGVDFIRVLEMCQTLPRSFADLEQPQDFASLKALEAAKKNCPPTQERSMRLAINYMTKEMPALSDRTRACIQQMCSAMLDHHVRDLYQDAFGGQSTWTPDDILEDGRILICGYDIDRFGAMGQCINSIIKKCVQRAIARRREKFGSNMDRCRPVVFVMDEAPFLVDSQDERFLRVGRENRAISLWAIQSIPSMVMELGGGDAARTQVDALLGHFHTKVMHQNECNVTNDKMADIVAKDLAWRQGININQGPNGPNQGENWNLQLDYLLPPIAFKQLKRGGVNNNWDVRAIVTMPDHRWSDGKRWQAIKFIQNCEPKKEHFALEFFFDYSPASIWRDKVPVARIWVKHVPFLQLLRDVWRRPEKAYWLIRRWLAFWIGIPASTNVYNECEKEINDV